MSVKPSAIASFSGGGIMMLHFEFGSHEPSSAALPKRHNRGTMGGYECSLFQSGCTRSSVPPFRYAFSIFVNPKDRTLLEYE